MTPKISTINTQKNLLAFSGGVDSSALFFILLENNIPFDIAIVNYNLREQSKKEVKYAQELAKKYDKEIYIKEVQIENTSNFEKKARDIRYTFFEELIKKHNYQTLITAHQLNDKLEWFFMQLSRGSGLIELLGFEEFTKKTNYTIFRPLINTSKKQLQDYLDKNDFMYYIDETNFDEKYKRNYFRKNFANSFIDEFEEGLKRSFEYLKNDLDSLNLDIKPIFKQEQLEIFENLKDDNLNIRIIDRSLKNRGILLSKAQRKEILKQKELVVSHKVAVSITDEYIYISPNSEKNMSKKFKESCRIKKIPKNIRAYIFEKNILEDLRF
jgi:tRNA(Ile)-lysidine synthase